MADGNGIPWQDFETIESSDIADDDTLLVGSEGGGVRGVRAKKVIDSKQDTLTDEQIAAANSGATTEKVTGYDSSKETFDSLGLYVDEEGDVCQKDEEE